MKFHLSSMEGSRFPVVNIDDEPDEQRRNLLFDFMRDVDRNEDLYLTNLAQAEAGTPVLHLCNHYVYASMFPDGRVVIEQMDFLLEESEKDHPPQTVITIAEARQLILDWLAAEKEWYAARAARQAQEMQPVAAGPSVETPKG